MYIYIYTHIKVYVHDMLTSPPGGALRSGDRHGPRRPRRPRPIPAAAARAAWVYGLPWPQVRAKKLGAAGSTGQKHDERI